MRLHHLVFWLPVVLTGCSITQQNGDLRAEPPPVLREQPWSITQQVASPGGDRVCTVSAGEVQITQRYSNHQVMQQVATSADIDPGDYYRITIGPQTFETQNSVFAPSDSPKIIAAMLQGQQKMIYTERQVPSFARKHRAEIDHFNNSLSLDGFAILYQQCTQYVRGAPKHRHHAAKTN